MTGGASPSNRVPLSIHLHALIYSSMRTDRLCQRAVTRTYYAGELVFETTDLDCLG